MATKYLHAGLGTGDNDGSSAANAWQSMADALAGVAAGDTVLSYDGGGEILAAAPASSTAGTVTNPIKFTAVNSGFTEDGTLYELDGDSAAANCLALTHSYYIFTGFSCFGATDHGIVSSSFTTFFKCKSYSNGNRGFELNANNNLVLCQSYSNVNIGVNFSGTGFAAFCVGHSNAYGFRSGGTSVFYRCVSYLNQIGFDLTFDRMFGCVSDENSFYEIHLNSFYNLIYGCILSNTAPANGNAIHNSGSVSIISVGTAFYNIGLGKFHTAANYLALSPDIDLTADPYENQPGANFNIALPNEELIGIINDLDGVNLSAECYGLLPEFSEGGGSLIDGSLVK